MKLQLILTILVSYFNIVVVAAQEQPLLSEVQRIKNKFFLEGGTSFFYERYTNYTNADLPVEVSAEVGLTNWLGVGVGYSYQYREGSFQTFDTNPYQYLEYSRTYQSFAVKALIHFKPSSPDKLRQFDPYVSFLAGFTLQNETRHFEDQGVSRISNYEFEGDVLPLFGSTVGVRYFPTPFTGAFTEVGYGQTGIVRIGVVLQVK